MVPRTLRRIVAAVLAVAGMLLMMLSPSVGAGAIVFGLGIALEVAGGLLERRRGRDDTRPRR